MAIACAAKPVTAPKRGAISVNGVAIGRAEIARETQHHPAGKPLDAMKAASMALVVRELLLQEARRLGFPAVPASDGPGRRETDDEALIRDLVEREVVTPSADEATCRRFHEHNARRFRTATLCEVRHILLPAAPGDTVARHEATATAHALIAQLADEPAAFARLAETESACPSGKTGGNLGQIGPGQTVPEFESAMAGMTVGAVHPVPVETRYGLHVVEIERRIEGRDLPFDLVRDRIAAWLDDKVRRVAIKQYITILAGRAEIIGIDIAATSSPLVQ